MSFALTGRGRKGDQNLLIALGLIATALISFAAIGLAKTSTTVQVGSATCNIAAGGTSCTTAVTNFVTPFSKTPNMWATTIVPAAITVSTELCFVCNVATTWTGMPAAETEIFGDANAQHEVAWDNSRGFSDYPTAFTLTVTCTVASNTLGAGLKLKFSTDLGVTWQTLANGAGTTPVDNTACPSSAGTIPARTFNFNTAIISPITCTQSPCYMLGVFGSGGGGVGDNPVFSSVRMYVTGSLTVAARITFFQITPTSYRMQCILPVKIAALSACTVSWRAEQP